MHRQHSPQPPPARRTATVHSEMPFLSGPSWSACARAPVSASLRCVQHHLHGHLYSTPLQCMHDDRDIDLYHWSSARFSAAWIDTISVLLAKGRARVGVADAATDWPRRIRDMQYLDHEGLEVGA